MGLGAAKDFRATTMCSTSARAVLLVDQAGSRMTDKLAVPDNITILPLPAECPELNPTENVWQFLRDNWFSNRVFRSSIATMGSRREAIQK
jgi:hypothetical protein